MKGPRAPEAFSMYPSSWSFSLRRRTVLRKAKALHILLLCFSHGSLLAAAGPSHDVLPPAWSQGVLGAQLLELDAVWSKKGSTYRSRPRLLRQGDTYPITFPRGTLDPETEGCVTVAGLATSNISFLFVFLRDENDRTRRAWPVPSAAGVAEVTRCGARKPLLSGLSAKMRSQRGVVDFLVVSSEHPPPSASEELRGRNSGPTVASPQVGKRPYLAPLKDRLLARKKRHLANHATSAVVSGLSTDDVGGGSSLIHLSAGCHKLDLLAESDPQSPPDLDARLHTLSTGELLETDEEHSGESSLFHCVGRAERLRIDFSGAKPHSEISLLHSSWQLPVGIPRAWGPLARARLAHAMWTETLPRLNSLPVYSSLGIRGVTHLIAPVEPDSCYLVAIAPIRGDLKRLHLKAHVLGSTRQNRPLGSTQGTSLSFCAQGAHQVMLESRVAGSGLAWILGMWNMSSSALEIEK